MQKIMSLNEKLLSDFMKFENVDSKYANVVLQVYLELCEVKKYWDVEYKYDQELKLLYIIGKRSRSENASIFIPRYANDDLSFALMQTYFQLSDTEIKSVFLALVCADSTCVYYEIIEGLQKSVDTSSKHLKLKKQEKLDAAIKKHRKLITEAALCGSSITINPEPVEKKADNK